MPDLTTTENNQATYAGAISSVYRESLPSLRPILEGRAPNLMELRRRAHQVAVGVKNQFAGVPDQLIERVLDMSLGFLRLGHETLARDNTELSLEEKELSARIQHSYAWLALSAEQKNADPRLVDTTYDVLKSWHNLVTNNRIIQEGPLPNLWRATEAEIAIVRALKKGGYTVRLPNPNQDTSVIPDDQNEVLQWDVLSGVDMIAEKNGTVLMIDAKGRVNQGDPELHGVQEVNPRFEWNNSLRNAVLSMNPSKCYRMKVFVPTDTVSLMPTPRVWPEHPEDPRAILHNFGRLKPEHESAIISKLYRVKEIAAATQTAFA